MELLEQCRQYNENGEYNKVFGLLQGTSFDSLSALVKCEVAEACVAMATDDASGIKQMRATANKRLELLDMALNILLSLTDELGNDHHFNFRLGGVLLLLNQEGRALHYFKRALECRMGDETTLQAIDLCKSKLSLPEFYENYRKRAKLAWANFAKIESKIRKIMLGTNLAKRGDEVISKCQDALEIALGDATFDISVSGKKCELILTPNGYKFLLFPLIYLKSKAPKSLLKHWDIYVGRQETPMIAINCGGMLIWPRDVLCWVDLTKGNQIILQIYCEKLMSYVNVDSAAVCKALFALVDKFFGEITCLMHIEERSVLAKPRKDAATTLDQLPKVLQSRGLDLCISVEHCFEKGYQAYELKPVKDRKADNRLDICSGSTLLMDLVEEYMDESTDTVDVLHKQGIAAGFFSFPLDSFSDENQADEILNFRRGLQDYVLKHAGSDTVTFLGGATGLYRGYLDFISWDIIPVVNAAQAFFEEHDCKGASFQVFRRDAESITLCDEDELDDEDK